MVTYPVNAFPRRKIDPNHPDVKRAVEQLKSDIEADVFVRILKCFEESALKATMVRAQGDGGEAPNLRRD